MEKILSLEKLSKEELGNIDSCKLKKIYNDLKKLYFFNDGDLIIDDNCKIVFYILKLNLIKHERGEGYIWEAHIRKSDGVCVQNRMYNFNLTKMSSSGLYGNYFNEELFKK